VSASAWEVRRPYPCKDKIDASSISLGSKGGSAVSIIELTFHYGSSLFILFFAAFSGIS
jgi:hypothetical protein